VPLGVSVGLEVAVSVGAIVIVGVTVELSVGVGVPEAVGDCRMVRHCPSKPGTVQVSPALLQRVPQQRPSVQKLERQSMSKWHGAPVGCGVAFGVGLPVAVGVGREMAMQVPTKFGNEQNSFAASQFVSLQTSSRQNVDAHCESSVHGEPLARNGVGVQVGVSLALGVGDAVGAGLQLDAIEPITISGVPTEADAAAKLPTTAFVTVLMTRTTLESPCVM
jgi:hypothetical protein